MKVTKRQLRRLIKEGNHAVDYAIGYEDARDDLPQNSDDPWYAAGYADYLEGIHDQYEALHQDGITNPPPQQTAARNPMSRPPGSFKNENKTKSITKKRLKQIIKEEYEKLFNNEAAWLINEEAADCVRDYMRMGYSRSQAYAECDDYPERGYGRQSRRPSYRRKTSYVGSSANADKIAAVEAALAVKPSNFLESVLGQLKSGRGLSRKQIAIVQKIMKKSYPSGLDAF